MNDQTFILHQAVADRNALIGAVLVESGQLSTQQRDQVILEQQSTGLRFGEAAQALGLLDSVAVDRALARQFGYPVMPVGAGSLATQLSMAYEPFSRQSEAVRSIRSQLMLRWFNESRKTLTIAGVSGGEGVSLFVANLAIAFSQLGRNVLLVDANLRQPSQRRIFGIQERPGLADMLAGRSAHAAITRIAPFPGLSLLQAGTLPPNPQELFARDAHDLLQRTVVRAYDIVLFDAPAFSVCVDALSLAERSQGVLLVLRRDRTAVCEAQAAAQLISESGARMIGTVLVNS